LALAGAGLSPLGFFRESAPAARVEHAGKDELRVIVRAEPMSFLPRTSDPVMVDRELAAELAASLDRELVLVKIADHARMLDALVEGEGDVVAASLTITPERRKRVAFSVPYLYVDELLVTRRDAPPVNSVEGLMGRTVSVRASSAYLPTLRRLAARVPGLVIETIPETWNAEDLAARVTSGDLQATVLDSHVWNAISGDFPMLHATFPIAEDRPIALAMRPDDAALRGAVNEFLFSRAFAAPRDPPRRDDLDGILARGRIRMITRNDPICYFLHRGTELGFELELVRHFAESKGLRLEVTIPPKHSDLVPWLIEGRGDLVAAAMPISPVHGDEVMFTRPYETAREVVVARADELDVDGPEDFAGRTIHVRESSPHFEAMRFLRKDWPAIRIALAPENMETEDMLACVEDGVWDAAICSSLHLEVERAYGRELQAAFTLADEQLGWIVRRSNPRLLQALNDFLEAERKSVTMNTLRRRYLANPRTVARAKGAWRSDVSGRISPYDDLAKKYAAKHDLDWRLLVAMMQEESGFKADEESWMGAIGLMQLLPSTAAQLGIEDPTDPESSVAGGARYLRRLIEEFDPKLPLATRVRFAIASYNVGIAHVLDAKRLASKMGWRSDRWFGHVERAILLLERPEYAAEARYGYCRGTECVQYVLDVEQRYRTFLDRVPGATWFEEDEGDGERDSTLVTTGAPPP
jgi:membrane-bound lytic murein transglycosylase F